MVQGALGWGLPAVSAGMPMRVFGDHATNTVEPPAPCPELDVGHTRQLGEHRSFLGFLDRLGVLAPYGHGYSAGIALEDDPLWRFGIPLSARF